jgi:hypothetical protein
MLINNFKNLSKHKCLFPNDGREINIYKSSNNRISGINYYYPNVLIKNDDMLFLPLLERTMSLKCNTIYDNISQYDYVEKECDNIVENVFFFIYNTDNYFHFLYDTLPYLISYLDLRKEIPDIKLLCQYPNVEKTSMYPFVKQFLNLLNIYDKDILFINDNTIYKEMYISTSFSHDIDSNAKPRHEIYDFYQSIAQSVKENYSMIKTPKKIYVSRRTWIHNDFSNIGTNYTQRRKMINENDLVNKLLLDGYEEVFTECLTTVEKIQYFSNCTHVIGAIGGGISNVLFSDKSTILEAIVSPGFLDINGRFKYSLNCVQTNYNMNTRHVELTGIKTFMRVKYKDYIGEVEEINDNTVIISYTDDFNVGWNAQNKHLKMKVDIDKVIKIDNGLNSPWILDF